MTIEALEEVRGEHRVYILEVEGDHEYLVGAAGVRARNTSPCGELFVDVFRFATRGQTQTLQSRASSAGVLRHLYERSMARIP